MTTLKHDDDRHNRDNLFKKRNDGIRLDSIEKLDPLPRVAVQSFFRELELGHLVTELIGPLMELSRAKLFAGFRDRPWPPWGLGAQRIHALCVVHWVADNGVAISPVFTDPEDLTNIGLVAALYKEVLEDVTQKKSVDVNYAVIEGSVLADRALKFNGFVATQDQLLTENARYVIYRADGVRLRRELGLDEFSSAELLAHEFGNNFLDRNAALHSTIQLATVPGLRFQRVRPEMVPIDLGRFGAALPGGVLS